ncbi:hypothetical protein AYR66_20050 [Noviherbaspirillum denitrificans]|uniref:Type II secretion system protein GspE N-terminal domain-containing protein n=1 Tax=Noviherbaspirillum denitrificans TaxID=1968433 RepID=A0A254TK68_9BURK|nr:hypothetical protein AYR66_20050 [Noviherbaspirillum denitrificans]
MLGQLLVRQKLISEEQLAAAIAHQKETGKRLGDILAGWNLLSQEHIQRAVRKQRELRVLAAFATALLAPLEALAAAPVPPPESVQVAAQESALRALSDDDLDTVSAAGLPDSIRQHLVATQSKDGGVDHLRKLATIVNPLLDFLDAETTVRGVTYDPAHAKAVVNPDGSITLSMPSSIDEISFEHIRVKGDRSGASFGSISLKNIDLTGTTITLSARK